MYAIQSYRSLHIYGDYDYIIINGIIKMAIITDIILYFYHRCHADFIMYLTQCYHYKIMANSNLYFSLEYKIFQVICVNLLCLVVYYLSCAF